MYKNEINHCEIIPSLILIVMAINNFVTTDLLELIKFHIKIKRSETHREHK